MKQLIFLGLIFSGFTVFAQRAIKTKVSQKPYFRYTIPETGQKDSLTFYLSEFSSSEYLPLIVYVQGSGSSSLFIKDASGRILPSAGHITWTYESKDRAKVLIIEKPGVSFLEQQYPNPDFDKQFSLDNWANRIEKIIRYVIRHEKIDKSRIMIAGHSEGGLVAARVAKQSNGLVTHTSILAGEGPSQLYSLYNFAQTGEFFNADNFSQEQRLDSLKNVWNKILADPFALDKKFWGFTYLRWSSFLKTSVVEELSSYHGKSLIIQGDADKNVSPESAKVLYTTLWSKGKDVSFEMIPQADHSFNFINNTNTDGWTLVIRRCLDWFLKT